MFGGKKLRDNFEFRDHLPSQNLPSAQYSFIVDRLS